MVAAAIAIGIILLVIAVWGEWARAQNDKEDRM